MKGKMIAAAVLLCGVATGMAQIHVTLPGKSGVKMIKVERVSLDDMLNKSAREIAPAVDSVKYEKKGAEIAIDPAGASRYRLEVAPKKFVEIYAAPGEKINLDVQSLEPFDYTFAGSRLMTDIRDINRQIESLEDTYGKLMQQLRSAAPGTDISALEDQIDALQGEFNRVNFDFAKNNPDSPAVAYCISNLSGSDCVAAFEAMSDAARMSPLTPFAERNYKSQKRRVEAQKATENMLENHVEVPAFTLKDINGNDFSLSSLRGKYVILDFWGSWCVWCIKGFPQLKENYGKYKDKLEVVGIDCNETEDAWKAGVARFKLPWINVYNPGGREDGVLAQYNIQGFPTKVLVDPEGHIVDICVGEDPSFYERLAGYLK